MRSRSANLLVSSSLKNGDRTSASPLAARKPRLRGLSQFCNIVVEVARDVQQAPLHLNLSRDRVIAVNKLVTDVNFLPMFPPCVYKRVGDVQGGL